MSSARRVGIGLGSNLGESHNWIDQGFEWLETLGTELHRSGLYRSSPVDCPPGSPDFVNAVGEFSYAGGLEELLRSLKSLERKAGRPEAYAVNAPRVLDLDILYAGEEVVETDLLTVPHRRMHERLFVLAPLRELRAEMTVPVVGKTVQQCYEDVIRAGDQRCEKIE